MDNVKYLNLCYLLGFWETSDFPGRLNIGQFSLEQVNRDLRDEVIQNLGDYLNRDEKKRWEAATYSLSHSYTPASGRNDEARSDVQLFHRFVQFLRTIRTSDVVGAPVTLVIRPQGLITATYHRPFPDQVFIRANRQLTDITYTKSESRKFKRYFEVYDSAAKERNYHRLANAFFFFEEFFHSPQPRQKIVTVVSCLESLFNTGSGEVSYKLASRCAAFLAKDKQERQEIFKQMNAIYRLRSDVVHGQSLGNRVYANPEMAAKLIYIAEDYARRCLNKIYEEKISSVFSSSPKALGKKLDALVISNKRLNS